MDFPFGYDLVVVDTGNTSLESSCQTPNNCHCIENDYSGSEHHSTKHNCHKVLVVVAEAMVLVVNLNQDFAQNRLVHLSQAETTATILDIQQNKDREMDIIPLLLLLWCHKPLIQLKKFVPFGRDCACRRCPMVICITQLSLA